MNKLALIVAAIAIFAIGVLAGKLTSSVKSNKPIKGSITIVAANDSCDGRPLFNVIFPDTTALDHMYAEEIAQGLMTHQWHYNERLKLEEDQ